MSDSNEPVLSDNQDEMLRLLENFLPKLAKLAEGRIADRYKNKFDGDDIAATVCRTVFRRFKEGRFKFADDAELWRLMAAISVRKISNKVRCENTQSRSIDRQVSSDLDLREAISREPDPLAAAQFCELLERLSRVLEPETMDILKQRLAGKTSREIADELGYTERTISRKLALIRDQVQRLL